MRITKTTITTTRDDDALTGLGQIGDQRLAVLLEDLRPGRHPQHRVRPTRAGAVLAHAVAAGLRFKMLLVAEVDQRVEAVDDFDDDIAATPAIAAIGPAELDELFAPERQRARPAHLYNLSSRNRPPPRPAIAGADVNAGLVQKLHRLSPEAEAGWSIPPPAARPAARTPTSGPCRAS